MGRSVYPTGWFIVVVHHVITRSLPSSESSIRSLASGPQPAHVTTECDWLAKQCVVLARLCSALESISFCLKQLSCTGRSTYVSVLTSSLMWYSVCCGESDNVLVVGAPHIRIYSANQRWIQLLDEHSKTSSPMRAAVAWDNYLPLAEHSRSGTPLRLIYRACEEVRGWVATGYDDAVLWGGREADLRTATIPSLPGSFPLFKSMRIAAGTWESCIRQLTVLKFFYHKKALLLFL